MVHSHFTDEHDREHSFAQDHRVSNWQDSSWNSYWNVGRLLEVWILLIPTTTQESQGALLWLPVPGRKLKEREAGWVTQGDAASQWHNPNLNYKALQGRGPKIVRLAPPWRICPAALISQQAVEINDNRNNNKHCGAHSTCLWLYKY